MAKKQKIKKQKSFQLLKDQKNKNFFSFLISLLLTVGVVFGADIVAVTISNQSGGNNSSNNAEISFSTGGLLTEYINSGNNSTIIGNYLRGYYYDSVFGFFRLDWSNDKSKNVRIISSTDKCPSGYGYKLGGKARSYYPGSTGPSGAAGFIDFNYNSSTFVYYCGSDNSLHGRGYSRLIGYQDFEGIGFEIISAGTGETVITSTGIFVNDNTEINVTEVFTGSTSNYDIDSILGEQFKFNTSEESIFYIIK